MTSSARREIASYQRISNKNDTSTSIAKQRANAVRRAADIDPEAVVVDFIDDGVTGQSRSRAGLDALMAETRKGRFSHVLVDTLDRLTRDRGAAAMWDLAAACEDSGAVLVGVSQEIDLVSSSGELSASIMAAAARYEARRTSDRVKATNAYRRRSGKRALGGPAPFGMRRRGADVIEPDPETAHIVRDAIDRLIAGEATINSLALEWSARKIPTPYGAPTWGTRTLGKLFRNPTLAGMVPAGADVLRGDDGMPLVDPEASLVPMETWNALQATLDARKVTRTPSGARLSLLHGLAVDEAGNRLYRHEPKNRPARLQTKPAPGVPQVTISMEGLNDYVVRAVLDLVGDFAEVRPVIAEQGRDNAALAGVRAEIERTIAAMRDPDADIAALASRLQAQRQGEAALLTTAVDDRIEYVRTGRTIREAYEAATTDDARREILAGPLEAVVVKPGKRGRHGIDPSRVDLVWRQGGEPEDYNYDA